MSTATTNRREIVRPASGRAETLLIVAVVASLLAATNAAVNARRVDDQTVKMFDWQISSFHDLKPVDQAVYQALIAASSDLWWQHTKILNIGTEEQKKDPWPTMAELRDDLLLEPFVEDAAWTKLGAIRWSRVTSFSFEGSTVYLGTNGTLPEQSAYLLLLSHVHKGAGYVNGATVWVHDNASAARLQNVVRETLIRGGWKEVVPYSGATEVERIRGNSE